MMITVRRRTVLVAALASALTASSASPALAAPGDLDTTFGGDGKVTTNFTRGFDAANAVAIQADGKIVAAGVGADGRRFGLARNNPDGTLDTTFGDRGKVTTNFTAENDVAKGVAIQTDGKIVVAGQAGKGPRFVLARYTSDGSLDSSFSGDGKVSTSFATKGARPPSRSRPTGRSSRREPPTRTARARSSPSRGTTPTAGSTRASAETARRPSTSREVARPGVWLSGRTERSWSWAGTSPTSISSRSRASTPTARSTPPSAAMAR